MKFTLAAVCIVFAALASAVSAEVLLPTGRVWQHPLVIGEQGDRIKTLARAYVEGANGNGEVSVDVVGEATDDPLWLAVQAQNTVDNILCFLRYDADYTTVAEAGCGPFEATRNEENWTRDYDRAAYIKRAKAILDVGEPQV